MGQVLWEQCLARLTQELSEQQVNTWLKPLEAARDHNVLTLFAPNRFVRDWVRDRFHERILELVGAAVSEPIELRFEVGSRGPAPAILAGLAHGHPAQVSTAAHAVTGSPQGATKLRGRPLNPDFTFETHVEGKSNQLARAAAVQVGENPGKSYNPLFLYGGVGLGKTHLMHAAGNLMRQHQPGGSIMYVTAEQFVNDMVRAILRKSMDEFKRHYREADALLIDDIQFFVSKESSQEEFFYTFNALLDHQRQVIITADRFPKELAGIEQRMISRFTSGLVVSVDPPDLETRLAIIARKAAQMNLELPGDVALLIARKIRSNIRELEGALRRILATARFRGEPITADGALEALRDILTYEERTVTLSQIQKTAAEYFKIRLADLTAQSRSRKIARPRQVAMALSKEMTSHSLPEIGEAFGGRDHTTVLHACRKILELRESDPQIREDYQNLTRLLSL